MIPYEDFKAKYNKLMSLSSRHPAFIECSGNFLSYFQTNLSNMPEECRTLRTNLEEKLLLDRKILTVFSMLSELDRVQRSRNLVLNRRPLEDYLFIRSICVMFLKEVDIVEFYDINTAILASNRSKYQQHLLQTFNVMKNSSDYYDYYVDFKSCLLYFLGNVILYPAHIATYVPVIEGFEREISATMDELSLDPPKSEVILEEMVAFGDVSSKEVLLSSPGKISTFVLLNFLRLGSSYYDSLRNSSDPEVYNCIDILRSVSSSQSYDPIIDFIKDQKSNTAMIYRNNRTSVLKAQNICKNVLSYFSPEMLLETALYPYYNKKEFETEHGIMRILSEIDENLKSLRIQGIISLERHDYYLTAIKNKLLSSGG